MGACYFAGGDAVQKLIQEYRREIIALQRRRRKIQNKIKYLQGDEYFTAVRRLQALINEEKDMHFALQMLTGLDVAGQDKGKD